ncbi:MAG: ExeM/NucH family extracellular endonuclease, partial [Smithella sp.]|nr:ExeM/NucH family extracellular endonuclease [Smithella sp.]
NGTGADVDLSAYKVELYSNGASSPTHAITLFGTLAHGEVFVLAHASADPAILAVADLTNNNVANWNGDDAIALRKVADNDTVDVFGQIGDRPSNYWGTPPNTTQDHTLTRLATICEGDPDGSDPFDPVDEWKTFPNNTTTEIGWHTTNCGPAVDLPTSVTSTVPANDATNIAPDTDITITFSESVTVVDGWFTISCADSGAHNALVTEVNPIFTLDPADNFSASELCTVTVAAEQVSDQDETIDQMEEDYVFSFTIAEGCGGDFTPIYEIQGSGMRSPMEEQTVTTEGVVVGDFQTGGKNGFYIQDEDGDNDDATSDGIFIHYITAPDVVVGDKVRVTGKVGEYGGTTTQLTGSAMQLCSSENVIEPTEISLPVESVDDFEKYEGMLVTFPQSLIISEYFNYDRYGEIVLTSQRHMTPTAIVEPGAPAQAAAEAYLLDRITLDDGRTPQNLHPAIHPNGEEFTLENLFRGGGTLTGVTGIMDYSFDLYRIQPTQGAVYEDVNPRSEAPDIAEGDLTIASFNVLNYFVTLDGSGNRCGPSSNMECRGADNEEEFERQRAKIVAALHKINADVYGLMEIENNRPNGDDPVADLVEGLNEIQGEGTYAYIHTGAIGTDAIKQAILYKPASVTPVGDYKVLNSSVDSRFIDTANRPVLAQVFEDNVSGEQFVVAVNHLKSKGSACDGDPDTGDGQGNCNQTRLAAAQAMVDWLADSEVFGDVEKVLIIGD